MAMSWKVGKFVIALVIIIGFVLVFWLRPQEKYPKLGDAPSFELMTIEGESYHSNNGKVKLLTFFYTKCPDICPLTMYDFQELQVELEKEGLFGNKVELISITLDPEFDTVPVITNYSKAFEANTTGWKFLRGTLDEIQQVADGYHMKFQKVEGDFIAHNTTMFLIDPENQIRGLYDMANNDKSIQKEEILIAMKELLKE